MPQKKGTKTTPSVTRGRSKSAGRTPSISRSRTRSRSRSRVTNQKTSRTPASESKIRRRRQSSPDIDVARTSTKSGSSASDDKPKNIVVLQRESIPSRFSQRIIEKIENNRTQQPVTDKLITRNEEPTIGAPNWLQSVSNFFRVRFCPSPITALLSMVLSIGCLFWLNFLLFSPSSSYFFGKPTVQIGKLGVGYQFLGVIWPTNWRVYFNIPSACCISGYFFINFVLARYIPFGRLVIYRNDARYPDYCCNAVLPALLFFTVFGALQYGILQDYGITKPSNYIAKYWIGMLTSTTAFVTLSAILVACRVKRVPRSQMCKEGNTGNFLVDMQNGRWVRPRWFGLDWKMFILRTSMIGIVLVDVCFGFVQWENYRSVSPALVATIVMEIIQFLDYIFFERESLSSDFVRRDGFGFSAMFTICWSLFLHSVPSCYLSTRPDIGRFTTASGEIITKNLVIFCSAILIFLFGSYIYFKSKRQKDLFCRQPNHPHVYGLPKIAGLQGQSILAGGCWGVVRYPDYLGTILMVIGVGIISGCSSVIPWIYPCAVVTMLLHRIFCLEHANLEEYGLAYEMYKKMVPWKLLPKLF